MSRSIFCWCLPYKALRGERGSCRYRDSNWRLDWSVMMLACADSYITRVVEPKTIGGYPSLSDIIPLFPPPETRTRLAPKKDHTLRELRRIIWIFTYSPHSAVTLLSPWRADNANSNAFCHVRETLILHDQLRHFDLTKLSQHISFISALHDVLWRINRYILTGSSTVMSTREPFKAILGQRVSIVFVGVVPQPTTFSTCLKATPTIRIEYSCRPLHPLVLASCKPVSILRSLVVWVSSEH